MMFSQERLCLYHKGCPRLRWTPPPSFDNNHVPRIWPEGKIYNLEQHFDPLASVLGPPLQGVPSPQCVAKKVYPPMHVAYLRRKCNLMVEWYVISRGIQYIEYICTVFSLDGISLVGAHVRGNLCYSTCLRHLIRSRAVTNRILYLRELPSNISTTDKISTWYVSTSMNLTGMTLNTFKLYYNRHQL